MLIFLLSGCKANIEKDISLNKILNENTSIENCILDIEVTSCSDPNDSKKPSKYLKEALDKVPNIFIDAEYKQCSNKKMDAFASFNVPIAMINQGSKKKQTDSSIDNAELTIIRLNKKPDVLAFAVKNSLVKKVDSAKKDTVFGNINLSIIFNVINDTKNTKTVKVSNVFANDKPKLNAKYDLKPNENLKIKLDLQTKYLFADEADNQPVPFLYIDK